MTDSMSQDPSPTGFLPAAVLKAVVSGREISLSEAGVPLVLVFHGQDTTKEAVEVNKSVRGVHPDPRDVLVVSVIDLRSFPSMFRGMVESELEKAYHNAAGRLPEGADPADHVILLPDWDGSVYDALGIKNANAQAAVIVADREGRVLCLSQENGLGEVALTALKRN